MKGDDPAIMMQVVYEVCGYMDPAPVPTMLDHIFVPHDLVVQCLMFNVVADHGPEILQVPSKPSCAWNILRCIPTSTAEAVAGCRRDVRSAVAGRWLIHGTYIM